MVVVQKKIQNDVQKRLNEFIVYLGISPAEFEKTTGLGNGFTQKTNERMRNSSKNLISKFYPELNMKWLINGQGEMLNKNYTTYTSHSNHEATTDATTINKNPAVQNKKKIPLYDALTIGGTNELVASLESSTVSRHIDTGDWFKEATSAIRHYGNSMVEYPNGSILALKRVNDASLIIWGRNYCIETTEFRITKRLQEGGDDYIMAYSSNKETYPDGTLVNPPIKIPKESIRHIDLVLGYVAREYSDDQL
jgi:hypothetical protein